MTDAGLAPSAGLRPLAAGVLGALAGLTLGSLAGWPTAGAAAGASLALTVQGLRDARRAERLLAWLRDPATLASPRDPGRWGEIAYRVEKLLRRHDGERARADDRLARLLAAIDASPNGVMVLDANDQVEWCNATAAAHFGLDPQRDRLQRVTNLVRSPPFVEHLQDGAFGPVVSFPAPGGMATLAVSVRAFGDGLKLVLSQDVTERDRADAMRRDFVANVSHEIRTPLTVLSGWVETLATLPLSETERSRVLESMAQQTQRIQALVTDLLSLAQLEGSPAPPPDRWIALAPLIGRALADAQALSGGRHEIAVADAGEGTEIAGSEAELHSAVTNLLHNAVRYTPDGGRIELRWRPSRSDGGGEIEVADDGIGIAREHLGRLTERFYRVDRSRSRDTGGTGLGLAIVKHVLQRHGGEVLVDSEPGRGSTFRLRLPPSRVRVAPTPASSRLAAARLADAPAAPTAVARAPAAASSAASQGGARR